MRKQFSLTLSKEMMNIAYADLKKKINLHLYVCYTQDVMKDFLQTICIYTLLLIVLDLHS